MTYLVKFILTKTTWVHHTAIFTSDPHTRTSHEHLKVVFIPDVRSGPLLWFRFKSTWCYIILNSNKCHLQIRLISLCGQQFSLWPASKSGPFGFSTIPTFCSFIYRFANEYTAVAFLGIMGREREKVISPLSNVGKTNQSIHQWRSSLIVLNSDLFVWSHQSVRCIFTAYLFNPCLNND